MTISWVDLAWVAVIVIAGCVGSHLLAMRKVRQTMAENHREMERRLHALSEALVRLEGAEAGGVASTNALDAKEIEAQPAPAVQGRPLPRLEVADRPATSEGTEVAPEIQAAIASVAIALLGNHARVRAARRVPSQNVVSPWTQQGRVIVQSSHNLRSRGR